MKLHVLASGSSGNAYCIENEDRLIFVDVGISLSELESKIDVDFTKPIYLFITHEHGDHIKGVIPFARKYMPKIYTSEDTAYRLNAEGLDNRYIYPMQAGVCYDFADFAVTAFDVQHDAMQPFGFTVMTSGGNIGFMTDLGCVTDRQLRHVEDADILVLESNYDDEMLRNGSYPIYLKRRVSGRRGHLSNGEAMSTLASLQGSALKKCLLAHVSEENNDYALLERLAAFSSNKLGIATHVLRQKTYSCFDILCLPNI